MDFNEIYNSSRQEYDVSMTSRINTVMRRTYLKMTLGLLLTALAAYVAAATPAVLEFFAMHPMAMLLLLGGELALVIGIGAGINKLSSPMASALFILYSLLTGVSLFPIFLAYTSVSIYKTFFITAAVFGAMTVYGYCTSQDLSRFGTFLFMALIGLIIVSVVNIFLRSSGLEWIISGAGVLIFIGLTAWDTQRIKQMALAAPDEMLGKVATIGALNLYLDFINLFLYLLRFMGRRN